MATPSTFTFSHSSIGPIRGNASKDGVLQFLGVQYATLADRFAPPVMREYNSKDGTIDATDIGPQTLNPLLGPDGEFALIQHKLDYDLNTFSMSDTEGLCLNVTVPVGEQASPDTSAHLPVFVFIHGGGYNVGSAMFPQYDMARFVQLSVRERRPCIGVALNYRLGAPGFLTSKCLRHAGYKPNNGLRDQRTALLWIRKHISGFGGDPENITLAGESAGGVSVCYHLFSEQPLFKRVISMSGTLLLIPPISAEIAEKNYEVAVKAMGLEGMSADEQARALVSEMESKELIGKWMGAGVAPAPVVDDQLCPTRFDFASLTNGETTIPGRQWCEAAIFGDCQFDGNIQGLRLMGRKKGIAAAFCSSISRGLKDSPKIAEELMSAYSLSANLHDDEGFVRVLQVANDINFYVPTLAMAQGLAKDLKMYVYRFNEPNPWDGPWKGHATHILDIAFLLQNFNDYLDEEHRGVAERFAGDVLDFVRGKSPWDLWEESKKVAKVMGPHGIMEIVEDMPEKVGRRSVMLELAEKVGFDQLNEAWNAFMAPPPPV